MLQRIQAGATNGAALLSHAFGPAVLVEQSACFMHLTDPTDPLGLHIMASNPAFHALFYSQEQFNSAFLHKRTAHFILAALYVA